MQITRRFVFDSAHRVLGHGGKCAFLHGHRYIAHVTVSSEELNKLGMVVDFSVVKDKVGNWINLNWDHNILLNSADPLLNELYVPHGRSNPIYGNKDPYVFVGRNPTAEVIAESLCHMASHLLRDEGVEVIGVRIYETENCWADYSFPKEG